VPGGIKETEPAVKNKKDTRGPGQIFNRHPRRDAIEEEIGTRPLDGDKDPSREWDGKKFT